MIMDTERITMNLCREVDLTSQLVSDFLMLRNIM